MQQNPHPGSVTSPTVPIRSETGLGGQAPSLLTTSLDTSALIQNYTVKTYAHRWKTTERVSIFHPWWRNSKVLYLEKKFKLWTTIWAIQQLSILTIPKAKHAFGYTYQTNATLGYEELDLTERTHISYNSL